ncbi:unnamed protein product [Amoebophrya sp. A25]|nr:unnamed protein product [Amoebophrya sp. A25]|eukprot:GSA25T00001971001.1
MTQSEFVKPFMVIQAIIYYLAITSFSFFRMRHRPFSIISRSTPVKHYLPIQDFNVFPLLNFLMHPQ